MLHSRVAGAELEDVSWMSRGKTDCTKAGTDQVKQWTRAAPKRLLHTSPYGAVQEVREHVVTSIG
jgi:hypothetical protein